MQGDGPGMSYRSKGEPVPEDKGADNVALFPTLVQIVFSAIVSEHNVFRALRASESVFP